MASTGSYIIPRLLVLLILLLLFLWRHSAILYIAAGPHISHLIVGACTTSSWHVVALSYFLA